MKTSLMIGMLAGSAIGAVGAMTAVMCFDKSMKRRIMRKGKQIFHNYMN